MPFCSILAFLFATAALSLCMRYALDARALTATLRAAEVRIGGNGVPASFGKSYPICRSGGARAG